MSPQDAAIQGIKKCLEHPRAMEIMRMVGDISGVLANNEDIEIQQEALEIINQTLSHKKDYEVAQQKN